MRPIINSLLFANVYNSKNPAVNSNGGEVNCNNSLVLIVENYFKKLIEFLKKQTIKSESYIIDSLVNRIIELENILPENSRFANVNLVDTQNIVEQQTNANSKQI